MLPFVANFLLYFPLDVAASCKYPSIYIYISVSFSYYREYLSSCFMMRLKGGGIMSLLENFR